MADLQEITERMWRCIWSGGNIQRKISDVINDIGAADTLRLYTYWIGTAVSAFNVMMPVEAGMLMNEDQLHGVDALTHHVNNLRCSDAVHAVSESFNLYAEDNMEKLGAEFTEMFATDPATLTDMVILTGLVLRNALMRHGVIPARMVVRAAGLRVQMMTARNELKKGDWCDHCLPIAMSAMEHTDDRKTAEQPADDDMSFLEGIDLEGFNSQ